MVTLTLIFKVNFTFTLVLDQFAPGEFDLDLQGQICHESLNICVIPCECGNFWTIILNELCFDQLNVSQELKAGDLEL